MLDQFTGDTFDYNNLDQVANLKGRVRVVLMPRSAPRTFEAAAAGCVQLYFLDTMEIFDYFDIGSEILTFSSVDDFECLSAQIISNPSQFNAIAQAGQIRAQKHHTFDNRCKKLLHVIEHHHEFGHNARGLA